MIAVEFLEKAYYILMNSVGEFDPKTKEVGELVKRVEELQRQNQEDHLDDEDEDHE